MKNTFIILLTSYFLISCGGAIKEEKVQSKKTSKMEYLVNPEDITKPGEYAPQ